MAGRKYRDRVTFQREMRTPDGAGGYLQGWADVLTVWGLHVPGSSREVVEAGRLQASESGTLTVAASSETAALTSAHRVLIRGVPFAIQGGPRPFGPRRQALDFIVTRGVAT